MGKAWDSTGIAKSGLARGLGIEIAQHGRTGEAWGSGLARGLGIEMAYNNIYGAAQEVGPRKRPGN